MAPCRLYGVKEWYTEVGGLGCIICMKCPFLLEVGPQACCISMVTGGGWSWGYRSPVDR